MRGDGSHPGALCRPQPVRMLTLTGQGRAYGRCMTVTLVIAAIVLLVFVLAATRLSPSRSYRDPYLP